MRLNGWILAGLMLVGAGCGAKSGGGTAFEQSTSGIMPGDAVDFDNDGLADGYAVDSDMDGVADGVDTNGDGTMDVDLQGGGHAGATTGAAHDASTGSGTSGSGTTGSGTSGESESPLCQEYVVRSERLIPDMLIVLDRSGSMKTGSKDRWGPSVTAIKDVTAQLENAISFGLMIFPADSSCGAGDIRVPVGPMTAMAIASELDAKQPTGSTPTAVSLEAAHMELGSGLARPDTKVPPKLVLLVTDGAPNCVDPAHECGPFDRACRRMAAMRADQAPITASVDAITSMASDGIKTYVVGYDTKTNPTLASAMDMMAAAGGTGDTQHRAVEDTTTLVDTLDDIAGTAVSCTFALDEAPSDPTYVLVTVDGQPVQFGQADGWSISPDGKTVEVQGAACTVLRSAGKHALTVEVKCKPIVIE